MSEFLVRSEGEVVSAINLMIETLQGIQQAYYAGSFPDAATWEHVASSGATVRVVMS